MKFLLKKKVDFFFFLERIFIQFEKSIVLEMYTNILYYWSAGEKYGKPNERCVESIQQTCE